jgi:hypothetical protein
LERNEMENPHDGQRPSSARLLASFYILQRMSD